MNCQDGSQTALTEMAEGKRSRTEKGEKYGTHGNDKHMYLVKEYVEKGLKGDGVVTLEAEAR